MRLQIILFLVAISCFGTTSSFAWSNDYKYISPKQVKQRLDSEKPTYLLDVQVKSEFKKGHVPGSIPTYAYPVKSNDDKNKLDDIINDLKENKAPVVLICPRGGGGAMRSHNYLKTVGIDASRMFILQGGIQGWPYQKEEVTEK